MSSIVSPRRGDRQVVERLGVGVADLGARADELHRPAALDRLEVGQVVVAREHLAGALEPVLGEGALEAADHRAADADVRVAPVVGPVGVAHPLGRDPDPAGHPDLAVGDQGPAVGAVGDPLDRVRLRRAEEEHLGARVAHLADQAPLHLRRAERVEDHVAAHALRAPSRRSRRRPGRRSRRASRRRSARSGCARPRAIVSRKAGKIRSPLISSSARLPVEIGAPVSASAARRKSGEPTSSSVPIS